MIENFSDRDRRLIVKLVTQALFTASQDKARQNEVTEYTNIISKLSGTDTKLMVDREYPSTQRIQR